MVIGASDNPARYSFLAINLLRRHGHPVWALGRKQGFVGDVPVTTTPEYIADLHTITLYVNPEHQLPLYQYIISLKPKRVIFNPGTENPELEDLLDQQGIPHAEACTLVMLQTGQY